MTMSVTPPSGPATARAVASALSLGTTIRIALAALAALALLVAASAQNTREVHALHHLAVIDELMFGVDGDPNIQYVEIKMLTGSQQFVQATRLSAWNADGSFFGIILEVPANVTNNGTNIRWIMASTGFEAAAGITPDFTFAPVTLPATGMICWGAPGVSAPIPPLWDASDPLQYVDCVPYGGYAAGNIRFPTATPFGLGDGSQSLTRTATTGNTSTSFGLACPTPQNNRANIGLNTDSNFIDQSPPKTVDDNTWIMSDAVGNTCGDTDDDNDGLSDAIEKAGPPCASATGATNPVKFDTDLDLFTDGAECALGSDPTINASRPANPSLANDPDQDRLDSAFEGTIGTNPNDFDSDDDGVRDGVEYRNYGSNPLAQNSDSDTTRDDCETTSLNPDTITNPGDQALLASEILRVPPPPKLQNYDINKDGVINPGDQAFQSSRAVAGVCPP